MEDKSNFMPILCAEVFFLRPWKVEDAAWYVESRDEEIFQWTTEKRELTVAETEEAIRQVNDSSDAVCLAIVDRRSMDLLGNIALAFQDNDGKSAEIMYWLAPAGRGRGIATNAVKLLCQWAFDTLGLERITLKTYSGNIHSHSVAQRAGFHLQEGASVGKPGDNHLWFELSPG